MVGPDDGWAPSSDVASQVGVRVTPLRRWLDAGEVKEGESPGRARRGGALPSDEAGGRGTGFQNLLTDNRELFEKVEGDRITTKDLLRELNAIEGRPWADYGRGKGLSAHQMAAMLRRFGIQARNLRVASGVVKGYLFGEFADAFARYLGSQIATGASGAEGQAVSVAIDPLHADPVADPENQGFVGKLGSCSGVAAPAGGAPHETSLDLDEYAILATADQQDGDEFGDQEEDLEAAYFVAELQTIQEFGS